MLAGEKGDIYGCHGKKNDKDRPGGQQVYGADHEGRRRGTAEFDVIHLVRHNPGITQTKVRETLKIDKGAAAKRVASLEAKGYLVRKPNPEDGRSQLLYATEKAEKLKNSKAHIETVFYEWLLSELPGEEKEAFCKTLDTLYWKSKRQRQKGFTDVAKLLEEEEKR